jgi:hypothetical protein
MHAQAEKAGVPSRVCTPSSLVRERKKEREKERKKEREKEREREREI